MKNDFRINLGLITHIISTIIYIIFVQYIVQSETIEIEGRAGIVAIYLFTQLITAGICDTNRLYKKYTND